MNKTVMMGMVVLGVCVLSVNADTVAYWRFESGPVNTDVIHTGGVAGQYSTDIPDVSGNGYDLSVWETGGNAGYGYRSDVGYSTVPSTGAANNLSVKNTGGGPAMWTDTNDAINSITPAAFTIEASFKLENGGFRTILGRDSQGSVLYDGHGQEADLAALYFQAMPDNALAIKYCDVDGYWHEAISATNIFTGFDWGSNPDGIGVPWYSMAAVSDGATLSLYLIEIGVSGWQLIAQTDLTASGSTNTALTAGIGDGGDWDAGNWTVGRGLFGGGHVDRGYGYIDEVRISDAALTTSEFLVPEPATIALLGLGVLVVRRRIG